MAKHIDSLATSEPSVLNGGILATMTSPFTGKFTVPDESTHQDHAQSTSLSRGAQPALMPPSHAVCGNYLRLPNSKNSAATS